MLTENRIPIPLTVFCIQITDSEVNQVRVLHLGIYDYGSHIHSWQRLESDFLMFIHLFQMTVLP